MLMKWLENFLKRTGESGSFPLTALLALNPERIEVENVRSVLHTSTAQATRICETAVRRGVFIRRQSVICPDGSVAWTGAIDSSLPETVRCWRDGDHGPEPERKQTLELPRREFFTLAR